MKRHLHFLKSKFRIRLILFGRYIPKIKKSILDQKTAHNLFTFEDLKRLYNAGYLELVQGVDEEGMITYFYVESKR